MIFAQVDPENLLPTIIVAPVFGTPRTPVTSTELKKTFNKNLKNKRMRKSMTQKWLIEKNGRLVMMIGWVKHENLTTQYHLIVEC